MVTRYGDDAAVEAAARADELLDEGDLDGARPWQRIANARFYLVCQSLTVLGDALERHAG